MNLKKLTDLNHHLQAAIQSQDIVMVEAALLEMMVEVNDVRKLCHLQWLKKNPKRNHETRPVQISKLSPAKA